MKRLKLFLLLMAFMLAPLAMMAQEVIYSNDFETGSGLPSGWVNVTGTAGISSGYSHGGSKSFRFYEGATIVVAMQSFDVDVSSLILHVWERPEMSSSSGDFEIGYITNVNDANSFVAVDGPVNCSRGTTYTEHTVDFSTANVPAGARIAFRQYNCSSNYYWFIDDLEVLQTLPCNGPKNISASDLTTTSVTLNWGMSTGGIEYPDYLQVEVRDEDGVVIYTDNTLVGSAVSLPLTGLSANTTYTVRMRGDCTANYANYSSYATFTFTTLCNPMSVPYNENFDNLNGIPDCTTSEFVTIDSSTKHGNSGKSLKLSIDQDNTAYIIFPTLNHSADDIEMGFYVKGSTTSPIEYWVGIVPDMSDIGSSFEALRIDSIANTSWQEIRMNTALTSVTAATVNMCIMVPASSSASMYIDDVTIHSIPTCVRPEQFRAYNPTPNTVDLSWTTTNATTCIVDIMAPDSTWSSVTATTNPFTVTGLQPNSQYSFRVRGFCAVGDTSEYASATVTAKTLCLPSATAIWSEDVELTSGSALPDCWTYGWFNRPASGTSYDQPFITQASTKHGGSRAFQLRDMTSGAVSYLTSPGFTIDQPNVYQASIWIYRPSGTDYVGEGLHLFASNSPDNITGAQDLGFINRCAGNAPVEVLESGTYGGWFKYTFPIAKTGVVYLIIQGESKYGSSTYFDDVSVELAPTCLVPGDITLGAPTMTDNTISWTASASGETSWVLAYDLMVGNNVVASDSLTVTSPNYTFTNLSAATTYNLKARVYALCSPTDMSEAKKYTGSFSTLCGVITSFPYVQDFEGGTVPPNCWTNQVVATTSSGTANAWTYSTTAHSSSYSAYIPDKNAGAKTALTTGELNFTDPNGYQVSFWMYRPSNSYQSKVDEAMHVYVSPSDSLNETTAVEIGVVNNHYLNAPAEAAAGWYQYTFNIPASVTGSQYVSFCYHNQWGSGSYIDDVMIRVAPSCRDLAAPVISDIQPTSAIVTIADTASTWDISYGPQGTAAGAGTIITVTDTNAYTLTGLIPDANYDVYVRRNCGTEFGMWTVAPVSFTAICTPATATITDAGAYNVTLQANANEWELSWGPRGTTAAAGTVVPVSGTNTYTLTGLTPATSYVFYVRHNCAGVYSDWSSAINAKTTIVPDSIPFQTGFEDATDNNQWTIVNGSSTTNHFVFGTDANAVASGSKALYISNSTSGTYGYSNSSTKTFAYRTIYFGSGIHNVSFKFKCTGGESSWDFASVMLVPASETLSGGSGTSASSTTWPNFAELFNTIEGQNYFNLLDGDANGWNTYNADIDMTGREGTYNFVVMWSNDGSTDHQYPISIDNLSISQVTCNRPLLGVEGTTSTGATIYANQGGASSQWEFVVSSTPIDIFGTVTGDIYQQVSSTDVVLTDLTANTAYYYTARAICGVGDTSQWAEPQTFRTSCEAYETPYTETFEDAGALNCWPYSGNVRPTRSMSYHYAGTASMMVSDAIAISPTLNITTLANSMLTGWAYSTTDSAVFAVGVVVDPDDATGTYEVFGQVTIPAKNEWTEFTVYFNGLNDPDYSDFYNAQHFAIAVGGDATVYVDNLYLGDIPTCLKPTETTITNVLANTFTIGWTENGTSTSWRVRAVPAAEGLAVIDTVVTTNPANIVGLNAASTYDVEIQAICSATDTSLVTNCGRIKTTCDIVNTPYEESFEMMTVGAIPDCWDNTGSSSSNSSYSWGVISANNNKSMRMHCYYMYDGDVAKINTPVITLPSATTCNLQFDYSHTSDPCTDLEVSISTDGGATWTTLGSYAKNGTDPDYSYSYYGYESPGDRPAAFQNVDIPLAAYAGNNVMIRFMATVSDPSYSYYGYGDGAIFVDNVKVVENRACATPTDLTTVAAATAHDVQIDWTAGGTETEWRVRVQNAAGTTYQNVTAHPCTITGLNAASNYNISVAAICGVGDTSYFSNPIAIVTACEATNAPVNETFESFAVNTIANCWDNSASNSSTATSTPYYVWGVYANGDNQMLRMYNSLVSSGSAIIETPEYILGGAANGYTVKFNYSHRASCGSFTLDVASNDSTGWTTLATCPNTNSSTSSTDPGEWTTVSVNLSAYNGQTVRFRFNATSNYGYGAIFVDDFRLIENRACADIVDFNINPSDTFAVVTINDTVATHTQWQYFVVGSGADTTGIEPILIDTNAFTVTGLTGSTSYDVYVRAYCDATEQSNWLMKSFRTTATPASFPYICQFTDSVENAQWTVYVNTSSPGCAFTVGNDPAALSPGQPAALYVYNGSGYGYNNSVSTSTGAFRLLHFDASQYTISFSWKCTGGESSYDYARFYLVPAADPIYLPATGSYSASGWPASLIPLDGGTKVNLVSSPEWNNVDMALDMTNRPGSYYLVFVWSNDGSSGIQYPLAINDIRISELACFSPANISIPDSTITLTSVDVNYDEMNGAGTNVRWWINTTGLRTDTLQSGVVTASPFTISNLTSATRYFLFMQTECSATDQSPVATARFTAGCSVITTFPFTEDFEDPEFPAPCWENMNFESGESYGEPVEGLWERYAPSYSSSYIHGNAGVHITGEDAKALLSTPALHFDADREYNMSFYMYRYSYSYYTDAVKVYLSDYATSIDGAVLLNHTVGYDPSITSSSCQQISFDLPAGISGDKHIIFIGEYNYWGYVYIDDINVDIYPTCRDLNGTATVESTTATTMTVSANQGPNHQGVVFAYAPATAASVADTIGSVYSTNGTAVIQGLTAGTTYKVYARGVCSETDSTAWTAAVTGTTMASDCFEPQNVHIVGIVNPTDVTITWGGAPDATGYEYMCIGTTIVDTVTTDTVVLTGLTPRTSYNFRVRTFCLTDTSAWVSLSFTTPTVPATLPYICDFEDAAIANMWEIDAADPGSQYNHFVVGSAISNGGSSSLYVSNDGSSYDYNNGMASVTFATRLFQLPAGQYAYSFDWNANGEGSYDYGRAFLVPASKPITPGTIPSGISYGTGVPTGWIALDNNTKLNNVTNWQNVSGTVTIANPDNYNMVFMWSNDDSQGTTPPLAIDNVQFAALTCSAPTVSTIASAATETTAQFVVNNPNDSKDFIYFVSLGSLADAFFSDTLTGDGTDTVTITGLAGSSSYMIYVKAVCGVGDESFVASTSIRTACGTATLPYTEGFEELPTSYTRGMIETICWSALNASQSSSTYPYYRASTSYATEGNQTLQTYSSNSTDLYLLLPSFGDVATCRVSFDCAYESLTSSGTFHVGYLTNPTAANTFVDVYAAPGTATYSMASHIADIAGMPAGSRIAFKYSQGGNSNYYGWLDNIRVFQLVQGPTYADTICFGEPYANYGFNVPISDVAVGDNTFTRTKAGVNGAADTVITANVYKYPKFESVVYDTACAGVPYSNYGFTIANPRTRAYTQSGFTSVTGCDSTVTLNLTVIPTSRVLFDTICEGGSYTLGENTYTQAGNYTYIGVNAYGCNDTTILNLAVADTVAITNATICNGETYSFEGRNYTTAGTYRIPGTGAHGCPMTKVLNLTVVQNDTTVNVTFCRGGFVMVDGIMINTFGQIDTSRWDATINCSMRYHITATEKTIPDGNVSDDVCEGHPYVGNGLNGVIITNDTTYDNVVKTAEMCDSTVHVTVHVIRTVYSSFDIDIKEGESYEWNNQTYNQTGNYTETLQAANGCDSVVTLRLHVSPVGVENVTSVKIDVVPNPVTAGMTAYVYGDFGEVENVEILNNFGQVVDRFVPSTYPIEVEGIEASGLYYVRVNTTDGKVYTEKLIVK